PPAALTKAVEFWRPYVDERAGEDLAKLPEVMRDQKAFARLTRVILQDLTRSDDSSESSEDDGEGENSESESEGNEEQEAQQQGETGETEFTEDRGEEGEDAESDVSGEQVEDFAETDQPEEGMQPNRAQPPFSQADSWGYKIFTPQFDEEISA